MHSVCPGCKMILRFFPSVLSNIISCAGSIARNEIAHVCTRESSHLEICRQCRESKIVRRRRQWRARRSFLVPAPLRSCRCACPSSEACCARRSIHRCNNAAPSCIGAWHSCRRHKKAQGRGYLHGRKPGPCPQEGAVRHQRHQRGQGGQNTASRCDLPLWMRVCIVAL